MGGGTGGRGKAPVRQKYTHLPRLPSGGVSGAGSCGGHSHVVWAAGKKRRFGGIFDPYSPLFRPFTGCCAVSFFPETGESRREVWRGQKHRERQRQGRDRGETGERQKFRRVCVRIPCARAPAGKSLSQRDSFLGRGRAGEGRSLLPLAFAPSCPVSPGGHVSSRGTYDSIRRGLIPS